MIELAIKLKQQAIGLDKIKLEAQEDAFKELKQEYPEKKERLEIVHKEYSMKDNIEFIQKNWDMLSDSQKGILKIIGVEQLKCLS